MVPRARAAPAKRARLYRIPMTPKGALRCAGPRNYMITFKALIAASVLAVAVAFAPAARAQITVTEDFTSTTSNNQWFFFNGACLTAGTNTSTTSPGYLPACTTVLSSYYNIQDRRGPLPDRWRGRLSGILQRAVLRCRTASRSGLERRPALHERLPKGHFERGAIVSASTPFPTGGGVQITFKTITYLGDSGGTGGDGADGISFYLLDGCMPITGGRNNPDGTVGSGIDIVNCPTNPIYGTIKGSPPPKTFPAIGATGGSLAYSCSNNNSPYDGLVGAYLGLGIDEFGNFLNGASNSLREPNSTGSGYGDNTATGGLYQPGRIGLRGAGSVSWQALNTAYGSNNGNSSPYYPSSLNGGQRTAAVQQVCETGNLYNSSTGKVVGPATLGGRKHRGNS